MPIFAQLLRKNKKNPEKQKSCPMTEMSEEKQTSVEYDMVEYVIHDPNDPARNNPIYENCA